MSSLPWNHLVCEIPVRLVIGYFYHSERRSDVFLIPLWPRNSTYFGNVLYSSRLFHLITTLRKYDRARGQWLYNQDLGCTENVADDFGCNLRYTWQVFLFHILMWSITRDHFNPDSSPAITLRDTNTGYDVHLVRRHDVTFDIWCACSIWHHGLTF
jgi:hypothetical protein